MADTTCIVAFVKYMSVEVEMVMGNLLRKVEGSRTPLPVVRRGYSFAYDTDFIVWRVSRCNLERAMTIMSDVFGRIGSFAVEDNLEITAAPEKTTTARRRGFTRPIDSGPQSEGRFYFGTGTAELPRATPQFSSDAKTAETLPAI